MAKIGYDDQTIEAAWLTLADLGQREWEAYVDADLTFLMGYASCDRFAEAALILRQVEGNGLGEKLAADEATASFVPPVCLVCIADTCPGDGDMVDFRLCAKGYRGAMLHVGSGSYLGEWADNPLGDTHPDRCRHYLGQSEAGEVWCNHPRATSAPDVAQQEAYMATLREVWR
ncbi:MAG: hypothetical protein H8D78_02120 [Chloroflexi bacterium]|nr:hypothetical protein [Chloroflexota bacterium]